MKSSNLTRGLSRVLKISRPHFWLYEAGTFSIGTLVAGLYGGLGAQEIFSSPNTWIFLFYFLIPANILIYGVNDIFDYETDKLNPKKLEYEALVGEKERPFVWLWIVATNLPFILYAFFISTEIALALILFCFFAIFYSAKPIRAKSIPFLDSFFSASHYVWTGFFGFYLLGGEGFNPLVFIATLLWAMAMHAFSAVPDIQADRDAGIKTFATFFEKKKTILICGGFYLVAFLISSFFGVLNTFVLLPFAIAYLYLMFLAFVSKSDEKLFQIYKLFPYLNGFFGFVIWWSLALILTRVF